VNPSSSLSSRQRRAAVRLFEAGLGYRVVAARLGVSGSAVARLRDRWSLRGTGALVSKQRGRVYSFEFKLEVVRRFVAGEATAIELAREYGLSSPKTVQKWVAAFRREGEDALRAKPKGRPAKTPAPADELQRLRQENLELSAKVAFLEKLRALREQGRG